MMNPDSDNEVLLENNPTPAKETPLAESIDIVAIDTETTGLYPAKDDIIEIAAVRYQNGVQTEVFNTFVKPFKEVPHYIEFLTHITPKDLADAPPLNQALLKLKDFVKDSVIVGQNTKFDLDFVNTKLIYINELPLMNSWWDTSELSRIYLPFIANHKLGTLCDTFDVKLENAHRAINDAIATAQVFYKLLDYIIMHHSVTVNARILELSRQAQLESNLTSLMDLIVKHQRRYSLIGVKPKSITFHSNNIIENKCLTPKVYSQEDIFEANGILHNHFEQFEFRAGQLDMAKSIESAFAEQYHLVVEAGTGVGKSFAYLIPALQFAYLRQTKVVVSTNTKNLQEQLFNKDIPLLKKILKVPFKAVLAKGRENYICERKWEEMLTEQSRGLTSYEANAMLLLLIWKQGTTTGDVSENTSFDRNRFSLSWRKLCSDRHFCAGRNCPAFGRCYVMKIRKNIESANLIVANHSLLLADLKSDKATLGEYEYLIIDEAHNIMQTAVRQLGIELGYVDVINQLNQLSKLSRKKNIAFIDQIDKVMQKSVLPDATKDHVKYICQEIEELIEKNRSVILRFFEQVSSICEASESFGKYRIKKPEQIPDFFEMLEKIILFWKDLLKQLHALNNVFSGFNSKQVPSYDTMMEKLNGIEMRAVETENDLLKLYNPDLENYALWLETGQKTEKNTPTATISYAPIEVDYHLNNIVYKNIPCIIFTSATMALRNSFKFFNSQSGLSLVTDKQVLEKVVESPFNYAKQSRLFVAGFLPEPSDNFFSAQALDLVELIIDSAPVGTLTLFTSYKDLDAAYNKLNDKLYQQNRPFFAQGKWSSRSALLDEFKKHNNAVLLGTSSFWEGIDVQGESLSLLILYKLPFQVPTEPIVEALIEKLEKNSKDSFMHYILPNALLRLRQGFGRLIRSKTDTGVVIIIDPRVSTKKYGHYFQEVLPTAGYINSDPLQMQSMILDFFKQSHSLYR
jgi:predicted DnaQ family exonuclease/DinG family helicase